MEDRINLAFEGMTITLDGDTGVQSNRRFEAEAEDCRSIQGIRMDSRPNVGRWGRRLRGDFSILVRPRPAVGDAGPLQLGVAFGSVCGTAGSGSLGYPDWRIRTRETVVHLGGGRAPVGGRNDH